MPHSVTAQDFRNILNDGRSPDVKKAKMGAILDQIPLMERAAFLTELNADLLHTIVTDEDLLPAVFSRIPKTERTDCLRHLEIR